MLAPKTATTPIGYRIFKKLGCPFGSGASISGSNEAFPSFPFKISSANSRHWNDFIAISPVNLANPKPVSELASSERLSTFLSKVSAIALSTFARDAKFDFDQIFCASTDFLINASKSALEVSAITGPKLLPDTGLTD